MLTWCSTGVPPVFYLVLLMFSQGSIRVLLGFSWGSTGVLLGFHSETLLVTQNFSLFSLQFRQVCREAKNRRRPANGQQPRGRCLRGRRRKSRGAWQRRRRRKKCKCRRRGERGRKMKMKRKQLGQKELSATKMPFFKLKMLKIYK